MPEKAKMTIEEWKSRYITRIVECALVSEKEATECYDAISDVAEAMEYGPEDAADSEMSYWES